MKTLLASLIVAFGAIVATVPAQAAPASQSSASFAKSKTYGGFAPGKTFKLKITDVGTLVAVGTVTNSAKFPGGVPKFKKGQKLKFKIGKKGQLTGSGFSIKFEDGSTLLNSYVNQPSASKLNSQVASVHLDSKGHVTAADLVFIRIVVDGFKTKTYTVTYVLEK